jgi:outer membrane murein-binding lipoprotein Lpp
VNTGWLVLKRMSASRRPTLWFRGTIVFALACAVLSGCGDDSKSKLLSSSSASELRSTLAQVQQDVQNGDCTSAQERVSALDQQISSLDRIDADLRDALVSGTSRLQQLVAEKCQTPATTSAGTTEPSGTTDTGGATGPDEETDKPGKSEGKGKGKKKGQKKNKDEPSVEIVPDTGTGGTGDGGTTDSGGAVP